MIFQQKTPKPTESNEKNSREDFILFPNHRKSQKFIKRISTKLRRNEIKNKPGEKGTSSFPNNLLFCENNQTSTQNPQTPAVSTFFNIFLYISIKF